MSPGCRVQGAIVNEEIIEGLKQQYGLEQPPVRQYFTWVGNLVEGDFGYSFSYSRPVDDLIVERLPATLGISLLTILVTYLIAIPIGIYSATHQYSIADYIFTFVGFIGLSVPSFLLALILMFAGYKYFDLSVGGLYSPKYIGEPWDWDKVVDMLAHLPIPVLIIGLAGTTGLIRVLRGTLLDEIHRRLCGYGARQRSEGTGPALSLPGAYRDQPARGDRNRSAFCRPCFPGR